MMNSFQNQSLQFSVATPRILNLLKCFLTDAIVRNSFIFGWLYLILFTDQVESFYHRRKTVKAAFLE